MNNRETLPFGLKWGMSDKEVIDTLTASGFEYDKAVSTFFGSFDWKNAPSVIMNGDVVVSCGENSIEEPLKIVVIMIFPEEDLYSEKDKDVYKKIGHDQQLIFNYFCSLYGKPDNEGERDGNYDEDFSIFYKGWKKESFFLTITMDKIEEDEELDDPAYMVSLTFSLDEELMPEE
jgi:hypothetical protein